jgi:hypothetical protein
MPLGFRGLACVLVSAFSFFALHERTWEKTIKFIADKHGIFFPCNELLVSALGQKHQKAWLLVPWGNITNVRIAQEYDNDHDLAACVAFDVRVSPEEQAGYFKYVGYPTDCATNEEDILSVAYNDNPPSPRKTFALLKELKHRHNISFQGTRSDDAASLP